MARRNYVVGIDVGTTQVRVVVGEPRLDGTVNIVGVGLSPSEGMKKGAIVDLDKTIESIIQAVEEAERMVGVKIENAYVGLTGLNVELINNRGVVAVAADDREIQVEDVERVLQATRVIALPSEREIVDIVPREYIVDGYDGIRDPVGMLGVRLEVDAMIITSPITSLRNLTRCINRAGVNVNGLVLNALANAEIALSDDEKELGVVLLDLGGGTTEINIFQHGKLRNLSVLPVGGDHITGDLAVGIRTSTYIAETLKIEHGCALVALADDTPDIEIRSVGGRDRRLVSARDLAVYIEPRVQEMFQMVREEMIKMGWPQVPPAGMVLTGGVAAMRGVPDMARMFFGEDEQVRLAEPEYIGLNNPMYGTAVGIVHYVQKHHPLGFSQGRERAGRKKSSRGIFQKIRDFFNDFME